MFRSIDDDDHFEDYEEYLYMEGGDAPAEKETPKAADNEVAKPAEAENKKIYNAQGQELDVHGLVKHEVGYKRIKEKVSIMVIYYGI